VRERNAGLARADDDDVEGRSGRKISHAKAGYPTREIPKTNQGVVGILEASSSRELPAIATDGKRRVVFLNPAAERLLGVRRKDVLGSELSSVLSHEAMDMLARAATLRIPGAVPHAERTVYILDPATISCPLSQREHEIVVLLTQGYAALNIAARLNLSHATVRNHIQNALRRVDVHSQVEIVALALRHGWVDRQEPRWNAGSASWSQGVTPAARDARNRPASR
jgi:DNA-binding CsgD family transcriptional regulator